MYNKIVALTGALIFSLTLLKAQPIIVVNEENTSILAGTKCFIKNDPSKNISIKDIITRNDFEINGSEHVNIGTKTSQNVWLKLNIQNTKSDQLSFIEFMNPLIDTVTLYVVENGKVIDKYQAGEKFSYDSRYMGTNKIVFPLKNTPSVLTYYANVKSRWSCDIKPQISTFQSFYLSNHYSDILNGIFIGIVIAFVLYNLFIFLLLKDISYLIYCVYLIGSSGFIIRTNGYFGEFVFRNTPQYNDITMVMTGISMIFGMLFTIKFLDTKRTLPLMHRLFVASTWVGVAYTLMLLFGEVYWTTYIAQTVLPLGTIFVFISTLILWQKGDTTAKYYFFGWFALFLGTIVYIMEDIGALPYNYFTAYALHIGISLEAITLSLAVIHRFKVIKNEKEEANSSLFIALKQNEDLVKEKNRLLEIAMEQRSNELQVALNKVQNSEEKLQDYARMLEKSNKELTDFAHIASHDLKAPIRGIMSFAQLFERRNKAKFDATDKEYFDYIKNNAAHSARLIEDLLNYSKIDKNLGEPAEVDMNNCVLLATMNLKNNIQEKNAEIIQDNLPILRGHSSLLTQLMQNLINNGIKYNKSEKPIIEIKAEEKEDGEYVYSVKDNGIGIPEEHQKAVFAMFRRLHGSAEYEGTGIGLAFCTRIVETYGGKLWLSSEEGVGTTFFFTLPQAKVVNAQAVEEELVEA